MMLRNNRIYPSLFWSILLLSSMECQNFTISESSKVAAAPTLTSPAEAPTPTATTQSSTWATVAMEETTNPKILHLTLSQVSASTPHVGVSPTSKMIQTTALYPPVESARPSTEQTTSLQTAPSHLHAVDIAQTGQTTTPPRTQPDTNMTFPKRHFTPSTVAPLTANSESASTSQSSPIDATSLSWERTTNSTAASVSSPSNPTTGPPSSTGTITPAQSSSAITTPNSTVDFELNSTSSSSSPRASSSTEFNPTTSSGSPTGLPSSSTRPSTTSRPSATNESSPTTALISVTSTVSSTTNSTNSSLGILIPRIPKKFPIPTIDNSTIKPSAPSNVSPQGGLLPCSPPHRNRLVGQCLIAVASLAGVASIFMVFTIVLCAKLSSRKHLYDMRRAERGTEMVCISALMSEERSSYGSHRPLKSKCALLPQMGDDSDEEGGDNLTLNSFLPESDRSV